MEPALFQHAVAGVGSLKFIFCGYLGLARGRACFPKNEIVWMELTLHSYWVSVFPVPLKRKFGRAHGHYIHP